VSWEATWDARRAQAGAWRAHRMQRIGRQPAVRKIHARGALKARGALGRARGTHSPAALKDIANSFKNKR